MYKINIYMCNIDNKLKTDSAQKQESTFPFNFISANYGIADARTGIISRKNYSSCTIEFVFEGKGHLWINGQSFEPETNSVYFLHKHSVHKYWPDKSYPWKKIFFVIDGN